MNIAITPELEQMDLFRRDIRAGFEAVKLGKFTEYDEINILEIPSRVNACGLERLVRESAVSGKF